jgi:lysophospholipase
LHTATTMRPYWLIALASCAASPGGEPTRNEALRTLYEEALPYYEQAGQPGTFVGAAGATIAYEAFTRVGNRDAIVFSPGRTEGSHTFMQLVYDLREQPYDVYVIDHRGQGASSRLIADPLAGHVDEFDNYVLDLDQLVRDVVVPSRYDHVFAVAHSMGGAITLRHVAAHPGTFDAVVLSAPMLQINTAPLSESAMLWYASNVPAEELIPGGVDEVFPGNPLTNDPHQFAALYETDVIFPDRRVGLATYGWVAESIRATTELRANAAQLATPMLLFQAGSDGIVIPDAQTGFCASAPACQLVTFPAAQHELFFAESVVRNQVFDGMLAFLAAHR